MHQKTQMVDPLISVGELMALQNANHPDLVVLDCSWHLPTSDRDPRLEFEDVCIDGARFFDIDAISDPDSTLPHMLPSASRFETAVRELGVTADSQVVVYDSIGLFSAARVWWMFRVFGHAKVQVLDGGMPAWLDAGGCLSQGEGLVNQSTKSNLNERKSDTLFTAVLDSQRVASRDDVQQASIDNDVLILDARSRARFNGEVAEPRAGLASGHIPGSQCLPFTDLLDNGHMRDRAALEQLLVSLGVSAQKMSTNNQTIITTCGSGVTAAVITLALEVAGYGLHRLYDGSWSEWGLQT